MISRLTFYNLSVRFETDDQLLITHIERFLNRFYTVTGVSFNPKFPGEAKVFVGKIKGKGIYQFHNTQFVHLYQYLKDVNYPLKVDEKEDERVYKAVSTNFKVRDGWELRPHQKPVYDFLLADPTKSKLVPLATGQGKTATFLITLAQIKKRLAVVILSRFCEKWVLDIATIHQVTTKDVMLIQGGKSLCGLIQMAKEGTLKHDYFVFSAETIQAYISAYEEDPMAAEDFYGCSPMDLFPLLGVGVMMNDESHMSFHLIYRIIIYTNVQFQVGLTATLITEDSTIARVHKVVYSDKDTYQGAKLDKYIDVYAIAYTISDNARRDVKIANYGSNNYSHIAFEQSIMRRDRLAHQYYKVIDEALQYYYFADYEDKDKVLIFVATINLANKLVGYLSAKYPERVVKRYCEDDPYEDLMTGEIVVTTVLSAGTGVDIPNLRVGIQTVSISSPSSNIQTLGRLRKLPDRDVKFCYLYSPNIGKQRQYSQKRVELFQPRVANICHRASKSGIH